MIKKMIIVALTLCFLLNRASALSGGIHNAALDDRIKEIADWTLDKINTYTSVDGTYSILSIKNIGLFIS